MGLRPNDDGLLAVVEFETAATLADRRYLVALLLQTLMLAIMVPMLVEYARDVSQGMDVLSSRAEGFAPIGVWGEGGSLLETMLHEEKRLKLEHVGSEAEAWAGLESGRFCLIVGITSVPEMTIRYVVNHRDPRSASARAILELVFASYQRTKQRTLLQEVAAQAPAGDWNLSQNGVGSLVDSYLRPIRLKVSSIQAASTLPSDLGDRLNSTASLAQGFGSPEGKTSADSGSDGGQFFSLVLLSFGLFFPLLSSSGILIESVISEKERRTVEALLAAPSRPRNFLIGKFVSGFLLSSLQVLALLFLLACLMRILNIPAVAGCILIISFMVLSAATLVSTLCMGSKEVNLAATILYVVAFVLLLGPLILPGSLAWISPFTPLVRLAAGGQVDPASAAAPLLGSLVISAVLLFVSDSIFGREEFLFGPRPSFRELLRSWVEGRTRGFGSQALWVAGMAAFATVPAMIFPSLFLLPSVAFFGRFGFFIALVFAAFVEEYFKPYGVYVLSPKLAAGRLVAFGALSGLSFSCVENVLFTFALLGTGALTGPLVLARYCLAPLVHVGLSILVVLGHSKGRGTKILALTAASFAHASYNLLALLVVT